jgi:tetraacyldisaccharide 4'-kinase
LRGYLYSLATDKEKGFIAGVIKSLLFILSLAYGLCLKVIIFLRRRKLYRLGCKLISVGNITLGGTGKTVLVEYIARYLKENGHKVAILTRGYKRKDTRHKTQDTSYEEMGDEAYMLAEKLSDIPVIVDADRIRAAKRAIQDYSVDTLILDDGFQQWQIKKDLEIVTIDVQNPFGNKRIIPRGILREPLANLRRADIFNLYHPQEPVGLGTLRGKGVVLFCGIGDPDSFTALISSLGINTGACLTFPDHHHYTTQDIDNIIQTAKEKNIDTIITTEKDMVRVSAVRGTPYTVRFLALRIKLEIKDEQGFHNRLLGLSSR